MGAGCWATAAFPQSITRLAFYPSGAGLLHIGVGNVETKAELQLYSLDYEVSVLRVCPGHCALGPARPPMATLGHHTPPVLPYLQISSVCLSSKSSAASFVQAHLLQGSLLPLVELTAN